MFLRILSTVCLPAFVLLSALPASVEEELVTVEVISEASQVRPGDSFRAGVRIEIEEGWHIYGEEAGISGLPTTVEWHLPEGVAAGPLHYPPTTPFVLFGEEGEGYENEVVLWSLIETSEGQEGELDLHASVSWLVCKEVCMPGEADVSLALPVGGETLRVEEAGELFGEEEAPLVAGADPNSEEAAGDLSLPYFLLAGFLGGLILNLMPCVFPILGLKIMGFVNQAGEARRKIVAHGLVFTAGVLLSFWVLAAVLIALRAGGQELGWGFQLQSPGFVLVLTLILLLFGLNMSGVFEFGLSAVGVGSNLTAKRGMTGSFFSGVLATVVATPCAAPFLAPALGTALILPPIASFSVFTAIALGLALPYLALSAFPGLVKMLPRPGGWMETLKQFLSFLLYGTVAFLLWVLAGQVDSGAFLTILFALVVVAMGCWVYGRWGSPHRKRRTQWVARVAALILIAAPISYAWSSTAGEDDLVWEAWSVEKEASLREQGRFVYVDFTARWCVTCQVNKRAYADSEVIRAFRENDVALLKADWTNKDPAITRALARFDRSAVPFNLIYAPGEEEPLIMPELFGPDAVLKKLEQAGAKL